MFQEIPVTEEHIYAFKATGKLSDDDYQKFLPRLTTLNHKYGPLSLLIELEDFQGWEPKAAWDDLEYGIQHDDDFRRIAIIGEKRWQHWMTALGNLFTHTEIRYFMRDDLSAAWDWLRGQDEATGLTSLSDEIQQQPAIELSPYSHILVAYDFSVYSEAALKRALELANHYASKLYLIHAIDHIISGYVDIEMETMPFDFIEEDKKIYHHAQSSLAEIAKNLDVPNIQHEVIWGTPKATVLSYAEAQNIDLIMVGSHGRHGLERLIGSTASAIMKAARCDVTVVKLRE